MTQTQETDITEPDPTLRPDRFRFKTQVVAGMLGVHLEVQGYVLVESKC